MRVTPIKFFCRGEPAQHAATCKNEKHPPPGLEPPYLASGWQPLDHSSTGQSVSKIFGEGNTYKVFLQGEPAQHAATCKNEKHPPPEFLNLPAWLQVGSPLTTLSRVNLGPLVRVTPIKFFYRGEPAQHAATCKNEKHPPPGLEPPCLASGWQPLDHSSTGQSGTEKIFGEGNTYKVFLQGRACSACCHMQERKTPTTWSRTSLLGFRLAAP